MTSITMSALTTCKYNVNNDIKSMVSAEDILQKCKSLSSNEEKIEENLESLLQQRCHLEAKLSGLQKLVPSLQMVHSDSHQLASMISFTSTLATDVSAKVRQLDLAKSRVADCQKRVNDLLDLKFCSDGVQTALQNEDYEQAAAHIHRFLTLDENILKLSVKHVSSKKDSGLDDSFSRLHKAEAQLRLVIVRKFDEAVRDEDLASVERFFKIFPLLNQHEEGLRRFTLYLCAKLQNAASSNLKQAQSTSGDNRRAAIVWADTVTLLFEGIARIVEIHQPLVETFYGPGRMLAVIGVLQEECDRQITKVISEFRRFRQFDRKVGLISDCLRGAKAEKLDPRELDVLLGELTLINARAELYVRFIRRRIASDIEVAFHGQDCMDDKFAELHAMIKNSALCKGMQELVGQYIMLERYFLTENIQKAIAMDTIEDGSATSSVVDDVFFIVKKCVRRALSSGSVDGVCAMINNSCTLLEADYSNMLYSHIKLGYPSGYLDLTQAYNVLQTSIQQGKLQSSDTDKTKAMFLTALNNAEASLEYLQTLKQNLSDEIWAHLTSPLPQEGAKIDSCLTGMEVVAAKFRTIVDQGMIQLRSSAVKPRVKPWVDSFLSTSHDVTEEEFSNYEANDPFVQTFIVHLDGLLASFKDTLADINYDAFVGLVISEVTTQLEKAITKSKFNRLGGLQLDKEIRALVTYLTGVTTWTVRDKFARLTQMATILNLERVSEILDYWGANSGPLTWRLTPGEVRQVLALRIDFRNEDIKRLKL